MTAICRLIRTDVSDRPRAFAWNGAIAPARLEKWIAERALEVPADLLKLWLTFGGGVIFESEEILSPLGEPDWALNFDKTNLAHRGRGLPEGFFIFHEGAWISAVRRTSPHYVTLDPDSYVATREFDSLDDWYRNTVRDEFGARYGLKPLP